MSIKNFKDWVTPNSPERHEINGISIYFRPVDGGVSWSEWQSTFEKLLPKFEQVGWLEGLNSIQISDNIVPDDAVGEYNIRPNCGSIDLENDTDLNEMDFAVFENSREHVLTHEVLHHVHMFIRGNDYDDCLLTEEEKDYIQWKVGYYASINTHEAVAEIGAALFRGAEFSDEVIDIYDKYDGPPEAKARHG